MPLINTAEKLLLDWMFTTDAATRPTSWTVALFTTAPNNAGAGGVEVSGGSYARQSVTFTTSAGDPSNATNSAAVEWPVATAGWGTVVAAGVYDNGGNLLGWGNLNTPREIQLDDIFRIPAGELDINLIAV